MLAPRKFVTVLLTWVEEVAPKVMNWTPLTEPTAQKFVDPSLATLRIPPVLNEFPALPAKTVVVSMFPLVSTRPTTRCTVAEVLAATPAVPTAASYPVRTRYWPSVERVSMPSFVALPLHVRRLFDPLSAVGAAIDCTSTPAGVYSSRKTGAAVEPSAAAPSPTR